ncbi:TLD-domain-containing protein [Guyanagaster necrorhizus]|uniref:Oxidation resistance protein 1 n=1 Tax=Guyanagaster necrorhizus TaxID=856835 RepID=A0A9P8APH8_9AGAR|nr:TLD-domain-containing protein [Guyanagaster necrorhizus MCA 3950]KAG7442821.1 TLD-domain-containing protein [Guyanagaster necrorhizus MCA 3950]
MSVDPSSRPSLSPVSNTSSRHRHHSPTRSPTLSVAMPAPPIASTSSVSSPPPADDSQSRPSRWMNSLRRIDSLYHLAEPPHHEHPHPSVPVNISHKTPFAPHGNASEASSVVYIPPTGAPGYGGESYDCGTGVVIEKKALYIDLKGRREGTVSVLDVHLANMVRVHLPALSRLPRSWSLLYSLDQHGISLNTLYTRCEQLKPCGALVVFKDDGDTVFGAFVSDGIRQSRGKGHYGSGESFLWRYSGNELSVFKWTGRNGYVALCEPDYMSFGGGDGAYGLYIDGNLLEGSSAPCPTFSNEPLCSPGNSVRGMVPFECVGVEVWRVG